MPYSPCDRTEIKNQIKSAHRMLEAGQPNEALACLRELADTWGLRNAERIESAAIYALEGNALGCLGDSQNALVAFARARRLFHRHAHPYGEAQAAYNLGCAFYYLRRLHPALRAFEWAAAQCNEPDLQPLLLQILDCWALCLECLGETEETLKILDRALSLLPPEHPQTVERRLHMVDLLRSRGDVGRSETLLAEVFHTAQNLARNDLMKEVLARLAEGRHRHKDLWAAQELIRAAEQLPGRPCLRLQVVTARLNQSRHEERRLPSPPPGRFAV